MNRKLSGLMYVHGTSLYGAMFLVLGAALELICGAGVDEMTNLWLARPAAGLFLIVALCQVWGVIRFERRYN